MKLFFQVVAVIALALLFSAGMIRGINWLDRYDKECHGNCNKRCQEMCFARNYCPYERGE